MRLLFFSLLTLLAAVTLGLLAYQDPGYVLISRGNLSVEISLTLFVVLTVTGFAVLYFLLRLVFRTWTVPSRLRNWRRHQRARRARRRSDRGLIELAQGHWNKAERDLIKYAHTSESPLLNYLSAARAAQKQHAHERRDHYLALAHKSTADADFAVELTQAELQMVHGQLEQSLATLVHLHSLAPKHSHVLLLLMQMYEKLQSWGDLKDLLPALQKYKVINEQEHKALSVRVYTELLEITARQGQAQKLTQFWQELPRALRQDEKLIRRYAEHLIAQQQLDDAEVILRQALNQNWNQDMTLLYGKTRAVKADKQLTQAEDWLKGRENNPVLLLTLGRLSLNNELWGKARAYLEASIGHGPLPETYKELGQLLEKLGETKAAAECYRKGLLLIE